MLLEVEVKFEVKLLMKRLAAREQMARIKRELSGLIEESWECTAKVLCFKYTCIANSFARKLFI